MPSRKRAKGKARKAKAKESDCNLILHDDGVCRHDCDNISKDDICYKFVKQLEVEIKASLDLSLKGHALAISSHTLKRLKTNKEYDMIWDSDEETQQKLLSLFVNLGTNILLRDNRQEIRLVRRSFAMSSIVAIVAVSLEHNFNLTKSLNVLKSRNSLRDLTNAQLYDIVKFFHKRSLCQCLKTMYLKEKGKPRKAVCNYCKFRKDRNGQLYLCSGCLYFYYCGIECQAAAWPDHQSLCKGFNSPEDCTKEPPPPF